MSKSKSIRLSVVALVGTLAAGAVFAQDARVAQQIKYRQAAYTVQHGKQRGTCECHADQADHSQKRAVGRDLASFAFGIGFNRRTARHDMAHDGGKADKDRKGDEDPVHRQVEHGSAPKVSPKAFPTIEPQKPGKNLARSALSDEVGEFW